MTTSLNVIRSPHVCNHVTLWITTHLADPRGMEDCVGLVADPQRVYPQKRQLSTTDLAQGVERLPVIPTTELHRQR